MPERVNNVNVASQGIQGIPGVAGPRGETGAQGPPGLPAVGGMVQFQGLAAINLGGHRALTLFNGNLIYADNRLSNDTHRVLGISLNSAEVGGMVIIQSLGTVQEPSWNWQINSPVFLGVNGQLTQTPPVFPSKFLLIVGFPVDPTTLFVNISSPIALTL